MSTGTSGLQFAEKPETIAHMSQRTVPKISKWPFYVADVILVVLAYWIFSHYPHPLAPWAALTIVACVLVAALLAVWPHRLEYASTVKFAEAEGLDAHGQSAAIRSGSVSRTRRGGRRR